MPVFSTWYNDVRSPWFFVFNTQCRFVLVLDLALPQTALIAAGPYVRYFSFSDFQAISNVIMSSVLAALESNTSRLSMVDALLSFGNDVAARK